MTWLTVTEYLSHKWPLICYHRLFNKNNTTGNTCGAGTAYPSGAHEFTPVCSGVRVARYLVFCVKFCRSLFVLYMLAIVLSRLPFWYLQTFLKQFYIWNRVNPTAMQSRYPSFLIGKPEFGFTVGYFTDLSSSWYHLSIRGDPINRLCYLYSNRHVFNAIRLFVRDISGIVEHHCLSFRVITIWKTIHVLRWIFILFTS
jgi:hypothetical protein